MFDDIKGKLDDEMLEEVSGGASKWRPNVKTAVVTTTTTTSTTDSTTENTGLQTGTIDGGLQL